jgi:hypothetical protein
MEALNCLRPTDPDAVSSTAYFYDAAEEAWTVTSSGQVGEQRGIPLFGRPLGMTGGPA